MPRRLLIRPGAIGDFIVSLPALEHLAQGCEYVEVWAAAQNLPLARFAHRTASIVSSGLDALEPDPERLRPFDEIYSWYGAARDDFRDWASRHSLPFRFFPALPDGSCHAVDFYLKQVGACPGASPRIACSREPGGFAVIHPFSGGRKKCWPLECFHELASRLEQRMPVKWCAGPEEIIPGITPVRIDDLYDLACWLATADLYIGNDCGITHLAAAVGTPVIALFGPTDPGIWAPRGPDVQVIVDCSDHSFLSAAIGSSAAARRAGP
ncbi:MAG: glycosyltransferase family 9 protein [Bryobacteraceae bacterium]